MHDVTKSVVREIIQGQQKLNVSSQESADVFDGASIGLRNLRRSNYGLHFYSESCVGSLWV